MTPFAIDRAHPPRSIQYRRGSRYLQIGPWAFEEIDACIDAMRASLPELRAFMPFAHAPITREERYRVFAGFLGDWWAGRQYVAALRGPEGQILGGIGLHPRTALNPAALEVGFWSATPQARQGNMTLGARMMVVLCIDYFACDRLQVTHDEANVPSRGVVERCGFVFEGIVRNAVAEPTEEMRAQGYRGTSRHRLYSIVPGDLANLDWVEDVRAHTVLVDAMGRERPFARTNRH